MRADEKDRNLPMEAISRRGATAINAGNKFEAKNRVTRLGEFSPIWRLFSLGSF
jgi:hypothetical protein